MLNAKGKTKVIFILATLYSLLVIGCNEHQTASGREINDIHVYVNVFGEKYLATGIFSSNQKDSIEKGTWMYSNLDAPLVIYGDYAGGDLNGKWNFALNNGTLMSSFWSTYSNALTHFQFSMPFSYEEIKIDSSYFKLRTINDSLGRISIIVGVTDTTIKDDELKQFGVNAEEGLRRQGYKFESRKSEIDKQTAHYCFGEYFLQNDTNKNLKLYNTYGYLPSKRHFVEFTLYHDGPREDLVKIIYNLMVGSIYIDNERFFNPYTVSTIN